MGDCDSYLDKNEKRDSLRGRCKFATVDRMSFVWWMTRCKSFRVRRGSAGPGIQMQALRSVLDSGFALSARPGMTAGRDALASRRVGNRKTRNRRMVPCLADLFARRALTLPAAKEERRLRPGVVSPAGGRPMRMPIFTYFLVVGSVLTGLLVWFGGESRIRRRSHEDIANDRRSQAIHAVQEQAGTPGRNQFWI